MPPGRFDYPGGGKNRTILPPPAMKQTPLTTREAAALALALVAVAAGVAAFKAFAAILWAFYYAGALM